MPIEVRPSDVVLGAAEALRQTGEAAHHIYDRIYEADRVAQVNRQLAYIERQYQEFNQSLSQRAFEVQLEADGPTSYGESLYRRTLPSVAQQPPSGRDSVKRRSRTSSESRTSSSSNSLSTSPGPQRTAERGKR
jgi:hypothetical protein